MARMHARKKGKSGSTHPAHAVTPNWCKYTKDEVIELVIKLAKEGKKMSQIGTILRDTHGIPSVKAITGKSILAILDENKLASEYPEDLLNLMTKAVKMRNHLTTNKKDVHNRKALHLTESKIRRLVKYYKNNNALPKDWYYKPEEAALILKE